MRVAIVGAGISGLYLAWKLSQIGERVTVFEKRKKIGKEVCSGIFSQRILDFIPESKRLIQNEIREVVVHFPKRTFKIVFKKRFFVMDHYKLDNLVAWLAQKSGAKIILNRKIDNFPKGFDKIIGCDGANSVIRKKLNLPEPRFFLSIQGFIEKKDNSNQVETWPAESGFIWKIPRQKNIEYGIMEKPDRANKYFDEFLKKEEILIQDKKAALIPQVNIPRIPKNSEITLCGDATGLTKPWSGGGVIWSLLSVNILLKNFPDFIKYKKEVNKFFLPKIIFSKIIKNSVYFSGRNFSWFLPKEVKIEGDFLF
jgi:digeranylgeranylglycerophospholipid reductase